MINTKIAKTATAAIAIVIPVICFFFSFFCSCFFFSSFCFCCSFVSVVTVFSVVVVVVSLVADVCDSVFFVSVFFVSVFLVSVVSSDPVF